jgi:stage V sporulation protein G
MKVTNVRIQRIKAPKNKLLAFADVVIDDSLVICDFQIFTSVKGYFVGMPSRKMPDGTWKETIISLDAALADHLKGTILRVFEDEQAMLDIEAKSN